MTTLNQRLATLERSNQVQQCPDGLGWHYTTLETLEPVGGADALVKRLSAGTATPADREVMAAVPGGAKSIRALVTSMGRFWQ